MLSKRLELAGSLHRQFTQAFAEESAQSGRDPRDLAQNLRRAVRQRAIEG